MASYTRCADTHPELPIVVNGVTRYIRGGSVTAPTKPNDWGNADIIVGLDTSMKVSKEMYPWDDKAQFIFYIRNMGVPKDLVQFKKLLNYLKVNILNDKKIFVGCIGGHGRTGLVLAALVTELTGEKDSITYVRKNYCAKAVETVTQVDWLCNNFGVTKVGTPKAAYKYKVATNDNITTVPINFSPKKFGVFGDHEVQSY